MGKNKKKKKMRRETKMHTAATLTTRVKPEAVQVKHDEKRGIVCSECGRPVSECVC